MVYYFTEEHLDKAYQQMTEQLIEETGLGMTPRNTVTIWNLLSFLYYQVHHEGEGLAFEKKERPPVDDALNSLVACGYFSHFEDEELDYFRMTEKFKSFIKSHFPREAMLWEPDHDMEDEEY